MSYLPSTYLRNRSEILKLSIAAIVAMVVLTMWTAAAVSIYFSRDAVLAEMKSNAINLTFAFDDEVTHTLDSSDAIMDALAIRMRAKGSDMNIYAWGKKLSIVTGPIIEAGIITPNGILISSTRAPKLKPIDLSDREHFRIQLDGKFKGLFIGKPVISRVYNQMVIPISKRVESADGRFIGVLVLLVSPAQLTKLNKSMDLGKDGTITLVGLDDIVRARFTKNSSDGLDGIGKSLTNATGTDITRGEYQGFHIGQGSIDDVKRLYSFRRVAAYPLVVTIGLGYDEGLASWWTIVKTILAVAAVATLFLGALALYLTREITVRRAAEQKVTQLARTDPLTGLPNRRVFVEALQQAISRALRSDKSFAILYLDLDHFKDINDTLGHMAGDKLLTAVGERLRRSVRLTDVVARFGGDEFAILQSDIRDPADAAVLASKLLETIALPFMIGGNRIQSGTSIGITINDPEKSDGETLLSHADLSLYLAKTEGRGIYRFFTESMDTEVHARVRLADELREAISKRQLFLEYQPQVEIETGRIIGLEALVRWRHPVRGLLPPLDFIEVAEKRGLIGPLGHFVLNEACLQMKRWVDAGIAPESIAVNVSAIQFKSPLDLEHEIMSILAETGLPAKFLEIELTESGLMEKTSAQMNVLRRLRATGVKLAIDDFGTGFSSLDYLRRLTIDRIKIAQVFMTHIVTEENDAIIVRAAIGLARAFNTSVIAEGVETSEQLALIRSWNCKQVQGFYYSRPLPVNAITALLRSGVIHPQSAPAPNRSRPAKPVKQDDAA